MFSGSVSPTAQKSTCVSQDVTISRQTTSGASTRAAATTTATSTSGSNSKWVSLCVPVGNSRQAKLWQCLHLGRLTGRFSVGLLHIFYKVDRWFHCGSFPNHYIGWFSSKFVVPSNSFFLIDVIKNLLDKCAHYGELYSGLNVFKTQVG